MDIISCIMWCNYLKWSNILILLWFVKISFYVILFSQIILYYNIILYHNIKPVCKRNFTFYDSYMRISKKMQLKPE